MHGSKSKIKRLATPGSHERRENSNRAYMWLILKHHMFEDAVRQEESGVGTIFMNAVNFSSWANSVSVGFNGSRGCSEAYLKSPA
jgi:hypothetical protein